MFYFNSFSLLDPKMRSTTLQAIKLSKTLGGVTFYDLNLPLPLWQSSEETKIFIQQAWDLADIIEVSKQELEFLCGIEASEEFDTKNNDRSKFTHYAPELIAPLWQDNLKILFVTNGTSKIHYYTKEHNGAILGMEDVPLTPYTSDMSASGDGIIAGKPCIIFIQSCLPFFLKFNYRITNIHILTLDHMNYFIYKLGKSCTIISMKYTKTFILSLKLKFPLLICAFHCCFRYHENVDYPATSYD